MEKIEMIRSVMLGHAVGDALGVPVEFRERRELLQNPLCDMVGFGTYPYPAGCWSDDTSMSLASLDSLCLGCFDPDDHMRRFGAWFYSSEYTAVGNVFDIGRGCSMAIDNYINKGKNTAECGLSDEYSNGNGSLMRIHPCVLFAHIKNMPKEEAIAMIRESSALTHAHERSLVGCVIFYFLLDGLLTDPGKESLKSALERADEYLVGNFEAEHYSRLFSYDFEKIPIERINSSGYIVDTLEAAVYCLLTTDSYPECVLKAVNLGEDTDTVAAIAGALAGALYGIDSIPEHWLGALMKLDYIEGICERASDMW